MAEVSGCWCCFAFYLLRVPLTLTTLLFATIVVQEKGNRTLQSSVSSQHCAVYISKIRLILTEQPLTNNLRERRAKYSILWMGQGEYPPANSNGESVRETRRASFSSHATKVYTSEISFESGYDPSTER